MKIEDKAYFGRQGFKAVFEHNLTRKISLQESNSPTQVYKITEELYNKAALLKNKSLGYFELRTLIEKALATGEAVKMSRTGYKARFSNEEIAKRLSQILKANGFEEMAFTILQRSTDSDMLRKYIRFLKSKISPMNNNEREMILLQTLKKQLASRTGTKAKFANRGAFAEASSSPVLGSLLEKKVMPEGGWRAVETDGGALVIAFEDGDIAGNFARRASENGYSATAPMAMAGRFWNVKVQNENKQ